MGVWWCCSWYCCWPCLGLVRGLVVLGLVVRGFVLDVVDVRSLVISAVIGVDVGVFLDFGIVVRLVFGLVLVRVLGFDLVLGLAFACFLYLFLLVFLAGLGRLFLCPVQQNAEQGVKNTTYQVQAR